MHLSISFIVSSHHYWYMHGRQCASVPSFMQDFVFGFSPLPDLCVLTIYGYHRVWTIPVYRTGCHVFPRDLWTGHVYYRNCTLLHGPKWPFTTAVNIAVPHRRRASVIPWIWTITNVAFACNSAVFQVTIAGEVSKQHLILHYHIYRRISCTWR